MVPNSRHVGGKGGGDHQSPKQHCYYHQQVLPFLSTTTISKTQNPNKTKTDICTKIRRITAEGRQRGGRIKVVAGEGG